MFKKILYVSLFVLIFLLAVQSVSASDTDLNDVYSDNLDFDESLSVYDSSNQDSSIGDDSLISDENDDSSNSDDSSNGDDGSNNDDGLDDGNPDDSDDGDSDGQTRNETVISSDPISFDYASEGELKINLSDANGIGLPEKTILVQINEFEQNLTTNNEGIAIFKFSNAAGTYEVNISFEGDEIYAPSSAITEITILKSSTKLKVPSVRSYLTNATYIFATLVDSEGNPIANKKLSFNVNGTVYNGTTDGKGVAKIKMPTKIGNYDVLVKFEGDANYYNSSASSNVKITKMKVSIISPSVRSYMTQNTYLKIYLKDVYGRGLSNKTVIVKIPKKTYNLSTDANGMAKLKLQRKVGTYNCTISFKATGSYYAASNSSKVVITKMPTIIKAPKISFSSTVNGYLRINLTNKNGKGLANRTVSISIPSIKKVYKVKTNEKGMVKFKFNGPKSYNITVKYKGNAYYSAKSVKSQFIIKKVKVKFNDIVGAANSLKNYISKNKALPSNLTYKNKTYTTAQLSYLMAVAINHANKKNYKDIVLIAAYEPANSSGEIYDTVYKDSYLKIVKKAVGSSVKHKVYSNISYYIYKIPYKVYTAEFSRALSFYKEHKRLPKYVLFTNSEFAKVKDNGKYTFYLTSDNIRGKRSELKMLKSLRKALKSKGYNAVIVGIGPDIHNVAYRYGCTGKNSVLLAVFGGVDVGCIEEWTGDLKNSNRNFVENYNGAHVLGLWFKKPYGASSSIHHRIGRAWDANYGFPLSNPAKYMSKHNISYIQTGTVSSACTLLKEGKMGGPKLIS